MTARNHVTSFVRNQARRDTVMKQYARETDSQEQPRALAVIQRAEDPERILNSLKTLDACERIVVTMYYVDNLKYFEIGEVLSLNINTVATIIRRAKQKLRKHLYT
ncbi:MAG: sigma-70 family RNA polymerase sigma factor [Candidatus Hydrogenedentota bacterium]